MKKIMKYMSMLTGTLLLAGAVAGCVDEEELMTSGPGEDSVYAIDDDEHGLGVVLSLDKLTAMSTRSQIGGPLGDLNAGSGRGLSDIEEFVNTDNLYILFFNLDGTFLFQINKPVAVPIGQSADGNDNQWFIRIPVKTINENLIRYIEENPFKIAVLANWTFDSDLNLGADLSGWDEFRFNEPVDEEGNLVYDEFGKLKGDHISMLSHAQRDNVYESSALKGGYDHLVYRKTPDDYPHMGPYTEWVANYHRSIDQADADIRAYFDVKKNVYQNPPKFFYDENGIATALDHFDTKYNNIWQVWNFGGADDSNFIYDMSDTGIRQDWLDLNQKAKDDFIKNNEYYFSYLTGYYNYFPFINRAYDVPVVKPLPPGYGPSSLYRLKWKMDNYSDVTFVMPNLYYDDPAIIPNYKVKMPEFDYYEVYKKLVLTAVDNFRQDPGIAGRFDYLDAADLFNLPDKEITEILDRLMDDPNFTDDDYDKFDREMYKVMMQFREDMQKIMKELQKNFNGFVLTWPNITAKDNADGNPLNIDGYTEGPGMGGNPDAGDTWGPAIPSTSPTYIHFKAHADGYVRVSYKARGGARLMAHVGTNNTPQNNASNYQRDNKTNRYIVDEDGYLVKEGSSGKQICDIPFDPKDVYLYMVVDPDYKGEDQPEYERDENGNIIGADGEGVPPSLLPTGPMIEIYGIEYIESRHLYDVDRRAVLPSKEYPIPMYGVQDFDPIGEYWEPGLLFNLSQFNNAQKPGYNYRHVSLLRSVARVEVKLLKSAFPQKPAHVYLRSMNRSSRNTPVDFFTPTDIIWNGFNSSSPNDVKRLQNYIEVGNLDEQRIMETTPGVVQEEKNIMQYGPIYIGTNANSGQSDKQKLDEYRKTTAWPFGIWEHQWGWDWNRDNGVVDYFDTYKVGDVRAHTGQAVPEYPRILHPRISRSDYSHFAEVDDPQYWHYIIYIPEKNITDADNPGNIADRPKIIHVELRFNGGPEENFGKKDEDGKMSDEDNFVDNFDDKRAYRLYFTNGGRASLGKFQWNGRDSWDAYEYDLDIVKQHWPILRNHVYTFTVSGSLEHSGSVNFNVEAPDIRYGSYEFY